jgi:hypothetical protein
MRCTTVASSVFVETRGENQLVNLRPADRGSHFIYPQATPPPAQKFVFQLLYQHHWQSRVDSPRFARLALLDLPVSWQHASRITSPRRLLFGLSRFNGSG